MSGIWLTLALFGAVTFGALLGLFIAGCANGRGDDLDLTYLSRSAR